MVKSVTRVWLAHTARHCPTRCVSDTLHLGVTIRNKDGQAGQIDLAYMKWPGDFPLDGRPPTLKIVWPAVRHSPKGDFGDPVVWTLLGSIANEEVDMS